MSQEGVNIQYPGWLRNQIEQNSKIWGVPTNFVGRRVSEARPITTSLRQLELEGGIDESAAAQHQSMDVDMTDAEEERLPSTTSPRIQPLSPRRITKLRISMPENRMPPAESVASPSTILPPKPPSPSRKAVNQMSRPTNRTPPAESAPLRPPLLSPKSPKLSKPLSPRRTAPYQVPVASNKTPRAEPVPSPARPSLQSRPQVVSPNPTEKDQNPMSLIEPHRLPSAKGKEKATTPVPTMNSAPSDILQQLQGGGVTQFAPKPLPRWYTSIEPSSRGLKELNKRPTSDQSQYIKALSSMKGCIEQCETGQGQNETDINELRNHVHKAEVELKVDRFIIRKMRMLDEPYGLPRIFASNKMTVPMDLKMDAWQLYLRWCREIFEVDILRGIKTRQGRDRNADSIDPKWKKISAKYYGEGELVLGQWWPTQLCLVRDGAHGSAQGGIYGEKEHGAYSIVLSGGQYDDEDNGDTIWYSGTDGKDYMPTENTLRLVESLETVGNTIRVFRSHMLPKKNPFRPVVGLRYDGLYTVERKALINKEKQAFRFFLVRCPGQHPIRYGDNEAARPTVYEIREDQKMRKFGR